MPHKLTDIKRPTPRDIDVAQACTPLPISDVARELGCSADDIDEHGKYMAKARATQAARVQHVCAMQSLQRTCAWPHHALRAR